MKKTVSVLVVAATAASFSISGAQAADKVIKYSGLG